MILNNIKNISYISNLVNADALIIDSWSKKFFDNFNFKWKTYQKSRSKIIQDVMFSSDHRSIIEHINYVKLKNLSNILINLKTDPSWVDILLTYDITGTIANEEYAGNFDKLVIDCINKINSIYE
jgi:hypothetical protein